MDNPYSIFIFSYYTGPVLFMLGAVRFVMQLRELTVTVPCLGQLAGGGGGVW